MPKSWCTILLISWWCKGIFHEESARLSHPKEKFSNNDRLSCHFCKDKAKLSQMWNHVGGHVLFGLWGVEDTKIRNFWKWKEEGKILENEEGSKHLGKILCEFCRQDSCFISLLEKNSGNSIKISVTLNCPYKFGNTMLYHLITEHSNGGILSEISGELTIKKNHSQKIEGSEYWRRLCSWVEEAKYHLWWW